jgi:hypothetical protein
MNLARHFSAGTRAMNGWSPAGTIEIITQSVVPTGLIGRLSLLPARVQLEVGLKIPALDGM